MPNHISSRCAVRGAPEAVARFRQHFVEPPDGTFVFKFEKVVPSPASKDKTSSPEPRALIAAVFTGDDLNAAFEALRCARPEGVVDHSSFLLWLGAARPKEFEEAKAHIALYRESGYWNWYDWNVAKWGTKWDAYEVELTCDEPAEIGLTFQTAWSFPDPVFHALATMFPDLVFDVVCFDEGWNFAGEGEFNGSDSFATTEATAELYEKVYGYPPESDGDDEGESREAPADHP